MTIIKDVYKMLVKHPCYYTGETFNQNLNFICSLLKILQEVEYYYNILVYTCTLCLHCKMDTSETFLN